ncbi:unnamed protein product [Leptidea sinapis]|uniref:Uncharacterized protein n=1 Tax=Leptidea sinapis TaxID=189913 RepID=A0A5E4QAP9_9NEOP|nr:unnamed protein product [Leptidea sinapis]
MAGQLIIINEFLTFVQNKLDKLDEQNITQICATNFTDTEIEDGKSILYKSCGDKVRHVQRKGDDKKKRNIKDVIRLLKEVDPGAQPNFVAKDLNRCVGGHAGGHVEERLECERGEVGRGGAAAPAAPQPAREAHVALQLHLPRERRQECLVGRAAAPVRQDLVAALLALAHVDHRHLVGLAAPDSTHYIT